MMTDSIFIPNPQFPNATNEQLWEQIRLWRNAQLAASDWTQLPDAPVDAAAWAIYRQQLRDIDDTKPAADYVSPTTPTD
jgi:hypothetical protein